MRTPTVSSVCHLADERCPQPSLRWTREKIHTRCQLNFSVLGHVHVYNWLGFYIKGVCCRRGSTASHRGSVCRLLGRLIQITQFITRRVGVWMVICLEQNDVVFFQASNGIDCGPVFHNNK